MSVAIIGTGLVSPAGLTPCAHACVLWAGALPPTASPFFRDDGTAVPVCYCPWLGARLGIADRASAMARAALDDALRPLLDVQPQSVVPLLLCLPQSRAGLVEAIVAASIAEASPSRAVKLFVGAAGFFEALRHAEEMLDEGALAVAVGAVDSYVGEDALAEHIENPPSPWGSASLPAAEGAAVVVVARAPEVRRLGIKPLGVIHSAGTAFGFATDDNDLPADGEAMGRLLRRLPVPLAPAPLVFGQFTTDSLRHAEWQIAVARNPSLVHPEYEMRSIEADVGLVGSAVGAMNLVYGLAVARHGTTDVVLGDHAQFLAWAISPDGARGIAMVSVQL